VLIINLIPFTLIALIHINGVDCGLEEVLAIEVLCDGYLRF